MSEQVHPCIFGYPEVFSRSWGLEVSRCGWSMMTWRNHDWAFNLNAVISNQCYLPNEVFIRVHWEGIKVWPKQTKKPNWAIFKKLHLPSLDKMWKGPSIDMGNWIICLVWALLRKMESNTSIYQEICQGRRSWVKLLPLLTKCSVHW